MEPLTTLFTFCLAAADDPRIGVTHVSLFVALLQQWNKGGKENSFPIERVVVMQQAKISSRHTYNRCLNDLQDYGYIAYTPSSNAFTKSVIELKILSKDMCDGQK